ncbi:MAG: (d)CMP kinase [Bacteroidales bacterium]|nr:(d)CMP kinase [Bacteroidales bacterium]
MIHLTEKIIVAVDGYSSCGKSSYAKLIARELDYIYLDSGAMYRTIALFALRNQLIKEFRIDTYTLINNLPKIDISFRNLEGENHTFMNGEDIEQEIRGVEVSSIVSEISKIPEIRTHLVDLQQQMGFNKGIVMDGRDIGTVVFPDAEIKIFMKANTEIRAKRRFDELAQKGIPASIDEIRKNINERDYLDMNRKVSPLVQAEDAIVLDNSTMSFGEQMQWFMELLGRKGFLKK